MTLRKIAVVGNPILRQVARSLTAEELRSAENQRLIDDLIETMRDAQGAGIAAPQVHESVAICVIEVKENKRYPYKPAVPLTIMVNPVIHPVSDLMFDNYEGCLSVPDLRGMVRRHLEIDVSYLDRLGHSVNSRVSGLTAGTYQHECDHLLGKLFLDRVEDPTTFCTWKEFERFHLQSFSERARAIVAKWGS